MTDDRHPTAEALAEAGQLAGDHPVLRHLAGCERCQATVLAFQRFVAEPADLPASDRSDARARLHAALRVEMGLGREAARGAGASRPTPARGGWSVFLRPAFVAAALVAGGVYLAIGPTPWRERPDALREVGGDSIVEVLPVLVEPEQLTLRWKPLPGADAYRVTLYTTDLQPVDPPAVVTDTVFRIPVASLRGRFESGRWLYLRVVALRGGDEIADSGPQSLQTP